MEPVEHPIDGVLDLHLFRPGEVGSLIPEYLRICRERGILRVRIIHGKGRGVLRETTHRILEALPGVQRFQLGGGTPGNWGATTVWLRPPEVEDEP